MAAKKAAKTKKQPTKQVEILVQFDLGEAEWERDEQSPFASVAKAKAYAREEAAATGIQHRVVRSTSVIEVLW